MFELSIWNRSASAFDDAIAGRASTPAAEDLAAFMASVADAVRPAAPFVSERGWRRLREALEQPAETPRVVRGALAPAKSTAILGAAMAGGGLLVAGAASGVDPALMVRQAFVELPAAPWSHPNASSAPATLELTVEGSVTSVAPDELLLDTGAAVVPVAIDTGTRIEAVDGRPLTAMDVEVGHRVRVRARIAADGTLLATAVALMPRQPAPVSTPGAAMVQRAPVEPTSTTAPGDPAERGGETALSGGRGPSSAAPGSEPPPATRTKDAGTASPEPRTPAPALEGDPTRPPAADKTPAPATARTPDATATATRTPEPTKSPEPAKTAAATKTPVPTITVAPDDTATPRPVDPTATPVPVNPVPTAATPVPGPKKTPPATAVPDVDAQGEVPVSDGEASLFR